MRMTEQNRRRLIWLARIAAGMATVAVLWLVVPPLLADSPVVTTPLKHYLSRQIGARVNVADVTLSTWGISPEIVIGSLSVVSATNEQVVAYGDRVSLRLSFWNMLVGRIKTTKGRAGRIDIEVPTLPLQRFLLAHGYLSQPLIHEMPLGVRQYMSFQDIRFALDAGHGTWSVEAAGRCDMPLVRDARFECEAKGNPRSRSVAIERFMLCGTRVVERHVRYGRSMEPLELSAPFMVEVTGVVCGAEIELPRIACTLGGFSMESSLRRTAGALDVRVSAVTQAIERIACIVPGLDWDSALSNVDARVSTVLDPATGRLKTEGTLSVAEGCISRIPFHQGVLAFTLDNDRVMSLTAIASMWDGIVRITLMDSPGAGQDVIAATNRVLIGTMAASGVDMNACIGSFDEIPAAAGGELNADFTFDMQNMGVAEFLGRNVNQFDMMNGQGSLVLSNAYLQFFATDKWLDSPRMPSVVRKVLGIAANLTGAAASVPLVTKIVGKDINTTMPRAVVSKVVVKSGVVSTPEMVADTPLGTLTARGQCNPDGELLYRVQVRLRQDLLEKYGSHPLFALFRTNDVLVLPVQITGTLSRPQVELDLTEAQRAEFENRLMQLIEQYVREKLNNTKGAKPDDETVKKEMQRMEDVVRGMIRKML